MIRILDWETIRPEEILTQVERLEELGLSAPPTVRLLSALRKEGWDVSLEALTVDKCADIICQALGA